MRKSKRQILVVDDDVFYAYYAANLLTDIGGYIVTQSHSVDEAWELARRGKFPLVIVDLKMPPGKCFDSLDTSGGHKTGFVLAREIKRASPSTKVIIQSAARDADLERNSSQLGGAIFLCKSPNPAQLIRAVQEVFDPNAVRVKSFIVHGRDRSTALELKNYLQNWLGFDEPTILAEQPSMGATILEKFEAYASDADWVFVLLTPDDTGHFAGEPESAQPRARQNVVFELGYFQGLMRRQSGRIILLHKGALEIPSDLSGIVYIDITLGIEAAGETIRRNLVDKSPWR
ncbi:MAG: TIR domain-containing protein [Bryobacteraceae bacterium]